MERKLNYKEVLDAIVDVLSDYIMKSNLRAMVIGLSGGLDSTTSAAICSLVSKKTGVPLYGVSLPCSTNKEDEVSGAALAYNEFCTHKYEFNIQPAFECVEKVCTELSLIESTPISQGNIKARLRMIMLYDMASKLGGIVIDQDMKTENLLGFYTLNGDVFDISPLSSLWKHEVYELAEYLRDNVFVESKALNAAINITPTDGNGVSNSDMDQIMPGHTYNDVDKILMAWVDLDDGVKKNYIDDDFNNVQGTEVETLINEYGKDSVKKVIMRNVNTEFKRYPHPIPIDIFKKGIVRK